MKQSSGLSIIYDLKISSIVSQCRIISHSYDYSNSVTNENQANISWILNIK